MEFIITTANYNTSKDKILKYYRKKYKDNVSNVAEALEKFLNNELNYDDNQKKVISYTGIKCSNKKVEDTLSEYLSSERIKIIKKRKSKKKISKK